MKLTVIDPPRAFEVGLGEAIRLKDCARIELDADEQVTFTTESGAEYDVTRKAWGFYATPSLNGRLASFGLRGVLVSNTRGQYFVLLVERGREQSFDDYLAAERLTIVRWLDSTEALNGIDQSTRRP